MPLQTKSQYHCKYALMTTIGLMLVSVAVQFMVYVTPESQQTSVTPAELVTPVESDLKSLESEGVGTDRVRQAVEVSVIVKEKQGDTVTAPEPQAVEDQVTKEGQPALFSEPQSFETHSPETASQPKDSQVVSQQSAF